ncbi:MULTISPECIES: hypothetical protein [Roseivirga]|jgi:hypothetical protein|uniref:Small multi-drug export protein n=1 Tax=Roseivirga spongicola TaxID=333140 RepID=A0A150XGB5_9BACT|nr:MULTISPECIES: hypothetical protein [Roseivirga]PWL29795.1 MAG: hypothetical protein DCO95_08095 [Roseivirga sp. XM-24bin3]KYG77775.1 hypothetical protein AWW68_03130 [Roseivirga spongicola]MBO6497431.1 hypothetical protein [Roseivirga sp.]MBO6661416.1 hypothetical protein [Roseivirga sp.]MBO6908600.1 hypothetical protein [Roseivirga sp.]
MAAELLKYLGLYLLACLKSIFPPLLGPAAGLSPLEIILITLAGLMTSVLVFNFLGERIKKQVIPIFVKNPKKFSPKSRRMVRIWKKYGVIGVCFLTPLILSPPGGALLVASVGAPRKQVFLYMFLFGIFWSVIWTFSVDWLIQIGLVG